VSTTRHSTRAQSPAPGDGRIHPDRALRPVQGADPRAAKPWVLLLEGVQHGIDGTDDGAGRAARDLRPDRLDEARPECLLDLRVLGPLRLGPIGGVNVLGDRAGRPIDPWGTLLHR